MTLMDSTSDLPKFGVGARVGETFAIFGSRFVPFAVVAVALGILSELPSFFLTGEAITSSDFDDSGDVAIDAAFEADPVMALLATVLVPVVLYTLMSGVLVLIAQDARGGQPVRIGAHLGTALRRILPLLIVGMIAGAAIILGSIALVVPGLWVMGVFAVVVPAVMIENAGFRALGRSASLTKGYRWPIVGLVCSVYVTTIILNVVAGFATWILPASIAIVLTGAVGGITVAIFSIAVVVVYMRLREIKEGVGVADLANVFA